MDHELLSPRIAENPGRGETIRTSDHLIPNQVRYQAALRPESTHHTAP